MTVNELYTAFASLDPDEPGFDEAVAHIDHGIMYLSMTETKELYAQLASAVQFKLDMERP